MANYCGFVVFSAGETFAEWVDRCRPGRGRGWLRITRSDAANRRADGRTVDHVAGRARADRRARCDQRGDTGTCDSAHVVDPWSPADAGGQSGDDPRRRLAVRP
jgi:hypothetical protein